MAEGIFRGTVTHPDGEWLIGNGPGRFPEGYPGLMEAGDPRGLMLKRWSVDGKVSLKYLGSGWTPPLPAHGGRTEFVQVILGRLACERAGDTEILSDGKSVELEPDEPRRWFLPDPNSTAAGITFCRHTTEGYEYHFLDVSRQGLQMAIDLLAAPRRLKEWRHQLLMSFGWGVLLRNGRVSGASTLFTLGPKDFAFVSRSALAKCEWFVQRNAAPMAVLYF